MTQSATVSNLARLLAESLEEVRGGRGVALSAEEIESASFLVFQAMTSRSRDYHDLSHLFKVAEGLPALAKLAAIYHDIVYFHVDGGFPPNVNDRIGNVVVHRGEKIFLTNSPDELTAELATIFGFSPGEELRHNGGLSEYLSAVLAVRELCKFLELKDLWAVAACIEATIPFRVTVQGMTPDELLGKRLGCLLRANTALTEGEIDNIRILAIRISNADVGSFGQPDLGKFLENTWQLLLETNPEFHKVGTCTIRSYREALVGVEGFLSNLDPRVIFRRHGTTPGDEEFQALVQRAENNLRSASEYLRATIAAMLVLEALAQLTGGDGPISYFTGAMDSGQTKIHDFLHHTEISTNSAPSPLNVEVLRVLKHSRVSASRFDTASSSLVAYLYELLGTDGIQELIRRASEVHAGKQDWRWFLAVLPREVVSDVATAISQIAVARKDRFREFLS
ncbi:MAG: hypothetical protein ABIS50_07405 [Luteolibacter sp.]|uniref:hypothetical protein n=1 Tax=Luteolibacter sp. TaxID=1962973 RepID=UPI0032635669